MFKFHNINENRVLLLLIAKKALNISYLHGYRTVHRLLGKYLKNTLFQKISENNVGQICRPYDILVRKVYLCFIFSTY